jgi:hypothetical protein
VTGYSGAGVKNSANRISPGFNAGVLHVCLFRSPARLPALHPGTLILYRSLVSWVAREDHLTERHMNGLIYLIGLIVVILFILSLLGLR